MAAWFTRKSSLETILDAKLKWYIEQRDKDRAAEKVEYIAQIAALNLKIIALQLQLDDQNTQIKKQDEETHKLHKELVDARYKRGAGLDM